MLLKVSNWTSTYQGPDLTPSLGCHDHVLHGVGPKYTNTLASWSSFCTTNNVIFFLLFWPWLPAFLVCRYNKGSCTLWVSNPSSELLSIKLAMLFLLCGWRMIWGGVGDFQWVQSSTCILVVDWGFCINIRVLILEKINMKKFTSGAFVTFWVVKSWCGCDDSQENSVIFCCLCSLWVSTCSPKWCTWRLDEWFDSWRVWSCLHVKSAGISSTTAVHCVG